MNKKFLISGLVLFVGALAFTFNSNTSNEDTAGLFVSSDNIAHAYPGYYYCKIASTHCTARTGAEWENSVAFYPNESGDTISDGGGGSGNQE
ncbi:hypothetical protein [Aquimarina aggregata]|uniref:hypothetical protein n=1 Tax=Aquimarina aggregata TaxID=1642818 RepID=UPI00249396EB|nr:hypothetical protein [Aquimarina aggregata]